jgi:thioredoxin-like negative regulator of GroEL
MTKQIHLFVQDGCRPCQYVKDQLSKVDGWESVITITNSKCCDEWTEFAKESGVSATPTLAAFEDGKLVARQAGSQSFTTEFFTNLIQKHGE